MMQCDTSWLYDCACNSNTFHSVLHCAQLKLLYHHLHPATFLLSVPTLHLHSKNFLSPFYHPLCPTKSDILNVICAIIQVALVLCLLPLYTTTFFNLTVFSWLHTWTMPREHETCGTQQNGRLCAHYKLHHLLCALAVWFRQCGLFAFIFFMVLPTNAMTHPIEEKKKQT